MDTANIARACEQWWQEHGGRHDDPAWLSFLANIGTLTTRKIVEHSTAHSNEGRFGMSKAGGCTRYSALKYLGATEVITGSTRFTFQLGHMVEIYGLATLMAIGVPIVAADDNGVQCVARIDPMMMSRTDGMVIPADDDRTWVRMPVSIKSAGYKMSGRNRDGSWKRYGWAQYPLDGVQGTSPGYWAQMQAEMAGTDTSHALLLVVAKDMIKAMESDPILSERNGSLSFYAEIVERDDRFIEEQLRPVWTEAWDGVRTARLNPAWYLNKDGKYVLLNPATPKENKALTGTYDPCSYCNLKDACVKAIGSAA